MPSFCKTCTTKKELIFHSGMQWNCNEEKRNFFGKLRKKLGNWISGRN